MRGRLLTGPHRDGPTLNRSRLEGAGHSDLPVYLRPTLVTQQWEKS